VVARVVYIEPTDSVVELLCQTRQSSRWHSEQRLDLVPGELDPELETRARRVPKEIPEETGVRQQATKRAFDVALAHAASPHARIAPCILPLLNRCCVRPRT